MKYLSCLRSLALCSLILLAAPAFAQTFPCSGNGPGQRMVGMHPGGNGVAPTPLCVADNSGQQQQPQAPQGPQIERVSSYMSSAFHDNSVGAWLAAGYNSVEEANAAALAACNQAMGDDACKQGAIGRNGVIVQAKDAYGGVWTQVAETQRAAEQELTDACRKEKRPCIIVGAASSPAWTRVVDSGQRSKGKIYPPSSSGPSVWMATAYADAEIGKPFGSVFWFQGGFSSAKEAERAVKAACERDSRLACTIHRSTRDVVVAAVRTSGDGIRMTNAPNAELINRYVKDSCDADGKTCTITLVYRATQRELVVHDVLTGKPAVVPAR